MNPNASAPLPKLALITLSTILALPAFILLSCKDNANDERFDTPPVLYAPTDQADADDPADAPPEDGELKWPHVYIETGLTLTVHQPQIESWEATEIHSRAAVEIQPANGSTSFGIVWVTAKAEVDKAARVVTIWDLRITKASFPTTPDKETIYTDLLRKHLPAIRTLSLDQLEASYAISQAAKKSAVFPVKNDPPRIIVSHSRALLVPIDGVPAWQPLAGTDAERAINTQALLVRLQGRMYLAAEGRWYAAAQTDGWWTVDPNVPAALTAVKQQAGTAGQVDWLEDKTPGSPPALVYVSTVPAELVQMDGPPQYLPVEGTDLLQISNSDNALFLYVPTNEFYLLISGRWFRTKSVDAGPWTYVTGKELPSDFSRIPADHPRSNALVSVPGTPQAQEAVIANSIPQTATVKRSQATVQVMYDGPPRFVPIETTALTYAVNTTLPVIYVPTGAQAGYYCVRDGVWFSAPSPTGPWTVAIQVPVEIYTIPPTSPMHYVTYVRVYGWTPDDVYVGYTPGYLGTVVTSDYVVVYGTGYYYRPYIGHFWVGYPWTYGFGASFGCGWYSGFSFGFSAGAVWGCWAHPWWGPVGWGWHHGYHYNHVSMNHVNFYHHWDGHGVTYRHNYQAAPPRSDRHWQSGDHVFNPYSGRQRLGERSWEANTHPRAPATHRPSPGATARPTPPPSGRTTPRPTPAPGARPQPSRTVSPRDNVYAGRDGQVYRHSDGAGWERRTPGGWSPAQRDGGFSRQQPQLDRERNSRIAGQQRYSQNRPRSTPTPARPSGGGGGGGSRGHR